MRVVKIVAREECSVSERRWWWAVERSMRPEWYCSASQAVVGAVMGGFACQSRGVKGNGVV